LDRRAPGVKALDGLPSAEDNCALTCVALLIAPEEEGHSRMIQYITLLLMMLVLLAIYSTIQLANIRRLLKGILAQLQSSPVERPEKKVTVRAS
jgi:hypothetical protein